MGNSARNEVPADLLTLLRVPASLLCGSACVTFCPRRVENVWISVLPVCKYKRCCIQYTNALRSGRKFGLEFFPLHSEHPHGQHGRGWTRRGGRRGRVGRGPGGGAIRLIYFKGLITTTPREKIETTT